MVVRLYGRPGCHLCEEAAALLAEIASGSASIEVDKVDIEVDEGLLARYLERIPVIEIDGRIVSELEPDPDAIARALHTVGP